MLRFLPIRKRYFDGAIPPAQTQTSETGDRRWNSTGYRATAPNDSPRPKINLFHAHNGCPPAQLAVSHHIKSIAGVDVSRKAMRRVPVPVLAANRRKHYAVFAGCIAFGDPLFPKTLRASSNEISHVSLSMFALLGFSMSQVAQRRGSSPHQHRSSRLFSPFRENSASRCDSTSKGVMYIVSFPLFRRLRRILVILAGSAS